MILDWTSDSHAFCLFRHRFLERFNGLWGRDDEKVNLVSKLSGELKNFEGSFDRVFGDGFLSRRLWRAILASSLAIVSTANLKK